MSTGCSIFRVGARSHRSSALLMTGWLLAAALLAPVAEVGDLLEAVVTVPLRPCVAPPADDSLLAHPGPSPSPNEEAGVVLARYVLALGVEGRIDLPLEPLPHLPVDPHPGSPATSPLSRDPERGPPLALA